MPISEANYMNRRLVSDFCRFPCLQESRLVPSAGVITALRHLPSRNGFVSSYDPSTGRRMQIVYATDVCHESKDSHISCRKGYMILGSDEPGIHRL